MLTDVDLKDLAQKMDIPLEAVVFKDELLNVCFFAKEAYNALSKLSKFAKATVV